jgi:ABC-type multidrug transport system fused ATPase/permease subunit
MDEVSPGAAMTRANGNRRGLYFTLYSQSMATFWRLLGFLRPYRRAVAGSLVFAWMAMVMTVAIPWLVGRTVNAIEPPSDKGAIVPLALAIVVAGLLRLGLTVVRRLIAGRVSVAVEFDLRERIYRHLQTLELGFFDAQQTGQLMSRATVDLQSIRFFLGYGLIFLTQNALTLLLASAVMFAIKPWLAALALAPVPFVVLSAARYSRYSRPAVQEIQQRLAELTAEVEESISGIRIVKAFAREEHMLGRFRRSVVRVFDQNIYSTRLQAFYSPMLGFLPSLGLAVVLLVGGRAVIDGTLSLGDFTAFYTYLIMLTTPMRMLGMSLGMAQRAVASGNRMFEILDREPRIESPPGAPALSGGPGRVDLEGVSLAYDGAGPALEGIDLSIPAGRTVALVGPTGSGKTSLVALLARLYDPSRGTVRVDGTDLRSVDLHSLRSQVAFVADDSFLFSATVAENIAYAHPGASAEEIESAARRAQAHGFIERLPNGYRTMVGERGLTLSGGQRQRIAIARALLADPRILILDDATSSVDARTEARIKRGLSEAMAGRTTFIVAHRMSTISLADEVVVMDAGGIVDRGTHEELLVRCPLYAEIAEHGMQDSVFLQRDLERREELARL